MEEDDEKEDEGMDWDFNQPPSVESREEWGARPATSTQPLKHPVTHVRFTYTGGELCRSRQECHAILQKQQRDDMEKLKLSDIQYNFLVGGDDSIIFEGRGWHADAYRPKKHDNIKGDCIDIAFIGNFKVECPPFNMDVAGMNVIKMGQEKGYIIKIPEPKVIPFRDHMSMDTYTIPKGEEHFC